MDKNSEKRVIIDLDMGSDDYLALLLLLHAEKLKEVKIEAITCCYGNTSVDNVVKNVIRLLEIEGRTDVCNSLSISFNNKYWVSILLSTLVASD